MTKKTVTRKMQEKKNKTHGSNEPITAEDKLIRFFEDVFVPYWRWIVLVLLVVILAGVGIKFANAQRKTELATALAEVRNTQTVGMLQDIADKYPDSAAGRYASFKAARQLYQEKQYIEAANAFDEFITNYPNTRYAPDALLGWAYCLEADKQYDAAQKIFKEAADYRNASVKQQAEAYCGAGRTALAVGDAANARKHYETALSLVDEGLYREQAESAIDLLERSIKNMSAQLTAPTTTDNSATEDAESIEDSQ